MPICSVLLLRSLLFLLPHAFLAGPFRLVAFLASMTLAMALIPLGLPWVAVGNVVQLVGAIGLLFLLLTLSLVEAKSLPRLRANKPIGMLPSLNFGTGDERVSIGCCGRAVDLRRAICSGYRGFLGESCAGFHGCFLPDLAVLHWRYTEARLMTATTCLECDRVVQPGRSGWYRCGYCGYESLRPLLAAEVAVQVARDLYVHWCQFDAPDAPTDAQLRAVASESLRQGDLFAEVLSGSQA